ncbi:multidrug efflux MFS transporter permease subunit VceB [Vibrio sp. V27_P1S3P104]|uniref:multidrug efflux MFS transporter permease subunit VceB n=1 Tax=Vibrio TaxID=662 RepID=UPI000C163B70|nr:MULTISPECIES: multidrug efflux MFS transporter permease subunit VceB [Vibrio]NAW70482.1 multidrug efflux MFS transporter permease subunit VceB [Vibrio sp. V28_P6S34P95]NAX04114.1 multidrug efflux MFS transporter permease subunit VceB [Vibrio sp. V30_P3S12P165]NAX34297.1 multidrug efflux MFS transporter permease subunit VceB [Vibrio sp. V29_P1S30P107]NAX37554.1 multidrug efflux MFS transporter permease subunit VceB [Vibrio sp. V27_P1S3P104]NAX40708.1 multidrug efflux MFS transporter permease
MSHASDHEIKPLSGGALFVGALCLAMANFLAILDTTIANVSVSTIAGSLGTSASQGTYVITSYAVAEAISVPLTGWLASRFGSIRVFVTCFLLFGVFSLLCGMANSMSTLVMFRIFLGFSGGPLMPLSQTLMMRIFPKNKGHVAIGIWSMTTLIAPIMGPILGGVLCDQFSWPYIFMVKMPFAIGAALICWKLLQKYETKTIRSKIDKVGLLLLVVWVAALQLMLDEGKDHDWFESSRIITLAVVAAIGFVAFLIWELTERNPVVDLKVFRHRGYSMSMVTLSLAFGAFFSISVLTPLWLQIYMGYTATISGYATATMGILAVFLAPIIANLSSKYDPRPFVFAGVMWLGFWTFMRSFGIVDMTFSQISWPMFFQGVGMPLFFVPLTAIALGSVKMHEMESAAGLMNFIRTLSGAFATSMINTSWERESRYVHAELSGLTDKAGVASQAMQNAGMSTEQARSAMDWTLQNQSVMVATNQLFLMIAVIFAVAGCMIWFAPKPKHAVDTSAVH